MNSSKISLSNVWGPNLSRLVNTKICEMISGQQCLYSVTLCSVLFLLNQLSKCSGKRKLCPWMHYFLVSYFYWFTGLFHPTPYFTHCPLLQPAKPETNLATSSNFKTDIEMQLTLLRLCKQRHNARAHNLLGSLGATHWKCEAPLRVAMLQYNPKHRQQDLLWSHCTIIVFVEQDLNTLHVLYVNTYYISDQTIIYYSRNKCIYSQKCNIILILCYSAKPTLYCPMF